MSRSPPNNWAYESSNKHEQYSADGRCNAYTDFRTIAKVSRGVRLVEGMYGVDKTQDVKVNCEQGVRAQSQSLSPCSGGDEHYKDWGCLAQGRGDRKLR